MVTCRRDLQNGLFSIMVFSFCNVSRIISSNLEENSHSQSIFHSSTVWKWKYQHTKYIWPVATAFDRRIERRVLPNFHLVTWRAEERQVLRYTVTRRTKIGEKRKHLCPSLTFYKINGLETHHKINNLTMPSKVRIIIFPLFLGRSICCDTILLASRSQHSVTRSTVDLFFRNG